MRRIRLTESQLLRVINNSVRRIVNESRRSTRMLRESDSNDRLLRRLEQTDAEILGQDSECVVILCPSFESLRVAGQNTNWSPVAEPRYFDSYTQNGGKFIVCLPIGANGIDTHSRSLGQKFLANTAEGVIVDGGDNEVSLEDVPSLFQQTLMSLSESRRRKGRMMY